MPNFATAQEVLEALATGTAANEIQSSLDWLPSTDRQAVLCTVCFTVDEVAANCQDWADEIAKVITLNCSFYKASVRTCGFSRVGDLANTVEPSNGS